MLRRTKLINCLPIWLVLVISSGILAMTSVASAETNVWIEPIAECDPGSYCNPLMLGTWVVIGVYSDGGLQGLDAVLEVGGPATIVSAIDKGDCADYGWDPGVSFDPQWSETVEIGLGVWSAPFPSGLVAYYVILCDDYGDATATLSPGMSFGGSMDENFETPIFTGHITVHQKPTNDYYGCLFTSSTSGGSVTVPGEGRFRYGWDEAGAESLVAQADVGYRFAEWTGPAVDAGNVADPCAPSTTVTMVEGCNTVVVANFAVAIVDIGLRLYDGAETVAIACEPEGTLTSPLRIAKNGTVYGVVLVDPGNPMASGIVIQTASGAKAVAKLP